MKAIVALSAKGKSTTEKMISEAGKTMKLLKSSEVHRLAYLLKNAHAIAKQNRPLTDYKWLCQVAKFKGLDIGNTYQTDHAARDSIDCIAKYERVFNGDAKYVVAFFFFFRSDKFCFSHSFSKLPDRMSDKLSWIFDMSDIGPFTKYHFVNK
jgi:hypothetical protein